jgi:hypothetical protein
VLSDTQQLHSGKLRCCRCCLEELTHAHLVLVPKQRVACSVPDPCLHAEGCPLEECFQSVSTVWKCSTQAGMVLDAGLEWNGCGTSNCSFKVSIGFITESVVAYNQLVTCPRSQRDVRTHRDSGGWQGIPASRTFLLPTSKCHCLSSPLNCCQDPSPSPLVLNQHNAARTHTRIHQHKAGT